jgi:hypothetical protein
MSKPEYKGITQTRRKFKDICDSIALLIDTPNWTQDEHRKLERLHAQRISATVDLLAELTP